MNPVSSWNSSVSSVQADPGANLSMEPLRSLIPCMIHFVTLSQSSTGPTRWGNPEFAIGGVVQSLLVQDVVEATKSSNVLLPSGIWMRKFESSTWARACHGYTGKRRLRLACFPPCAPRSQCWCLCADCRPAVK